MSDKLTYLYDGNFFLHKTLHVVGVFDANDPMFIKGDDKDVRRKHRNSLLKKLSMDFCSDVRKAAGLIEEIIITYDDQSWRGAFFNDKGYQYGKPAVELDDSVASVNKDGEEITIEIKTDVDYKGTRDKSKEVDWSAIYETFEIFLKHLEKTAGVKWVRIKGCEGDDIIFVVSAHYNLMGKNVMIYSGDNDLKQLINHNEQNNSFTIHFKKTENRIVLSNATAVWLMKNTDAVKFKARLNNFVVDNTLKLGVEDPYDIIVDKILCGDDGDNVLSVMQEIRKTKSGKNIGTPKVVRVTPGVVKKVKKEIEYKNYSLGDFFNDEFISRLANSVIRSFKPVTNFVTTEEIENNIKLNRDLMYLHRDCLPHSIYESMVDWVDATSDVNNLNMRELYSYKVLIEKCNEYNHTDSDDASSAGFFSHLGL